MSVLNIVVTGGAGYIGAHVAKVLRDTTEHTLHVIDNLSQSRGNVLSHPRIVYHEADLRDRERLGVLFAGIQPEIVFHFAALASVPDSVRNPPAYYDNNVLGTLNLLEAMRGTGTNKVVFSSSAAVYGEPDSETISEDHPKRPQTPYGRTKLICEELLADYFTAYGMSSVSLRYFCAAGADPSAEVGERHDPETHAIPSLVETLVGKRDEFFVYGNDFPTPDGTGIRDYIHVMDLAHAHVAAMDKLLSGEKVCAQFNLGINRGFSVLELIAAAERVTGKPVTYSVKPRRPGDPSRLIADSRKAQEELGWTPAYHDPDPMIESAYRFLQNESQRPLPI